LWKLKCSHFSNIIELLNLPEFTPVFSGVRVTRSLVLCVCFVDHCLPFCTFFFWSLCCLFLFDIRILITPLVSSNFSYSNHDCSFQDKSQRITWLRSLIYITCKGSPILWLLSWTISSKYGNVKLLDRTFSYCLAEGY